MTSERTSPEGRIVDRGYQHYQGARLGPAFIFWAMVRAALIRGLGLRRSKAAPIAPLVLFAAANFPIIAMLVLYSSGDNKGNSLPTFAQLAASNNVIWVLLFAMLAGPDLFCTERRSRVLSLYFASPITRVQYVLARVAGIAILLLGLTLLPLLVLFVGDALLSSSFAGYARDNVDTFGRILLSGVLLAIFNAVLVSLVSSFTDRRVYAGGAFIGLMLITAFTGGVLGEEISFTGHEKFVLVDLVNLGPRTARWIFELPPIEPGDTATLRDAAMVGGWAYMGTLLGVTAVSLAFLLYRYQKLTE